MPNPKNLEHNAQRIFELATHTMAHEMVEYQATEIEISDDIALRIYFMMTAAQEIFALQTRTMLMSTLIETTIQIVSNEEEVRAIYAKMLNLSCDTIREQIKKDIEIVKTICLKEGIKHDESKH